MTRTKLTVLYDERCAFCRRCRDWLADQPVLVEMELLSHQLSKRRESLSHWLWPAPECDECKDLDLHREVS
jgi:predicted DCC family thiol-disulfide oxidoreductase YuxK